MQDIFGYHSSGYHSGVPLGYATPTDLYGFTAFQRPVADAGLHSTRWQAVLHSTRRHAVLRSTR